VPDHYGGVDLDILTASISMQCKFPSKGMPQPSVLFIYHLHNFPLNFRDNLWVGLGLAYNFPGSTKFADPGTLPSLQNQDVLLTTQYFL